MKKIIIIFLVSLVIVFAFADTTVTQYGITWTFDKDYEVRQFINGDYYVIDPGSGVMVVSVNPQPSAISGQYRNGSMIDPGVGPSVGQSYDNRSNGWTSDFWTSFPVTIHSDSSLVSTISRPESTPSNVSDWAGGDIDNDTHVRTAAILTVLGSEVSVNAFRPPYIGTEKPVRLFSSDMVDRLPLLEIPQDDGSPVLPDANGFSTYMEYFERGFERPWLNNNYNWTARDIHPYENMFAYHQYVIEFWNEASLVLLLDIPYDKELLLIRYLQNSLDYYHMTINGDGDTSFIAWPVLLAGNILDDADIQNVFIDGRNQTLARSEEKTYYWEDHASTIESDLVEPGYTWTGATVFFRKHVDDREYEHLHPSEWYLANNASWPERWEVYRMAIDSQEYVAGVLSAKIMNRRGWNAISQWNHPPAFDYVQRWIDEDYTNVYLPMILEYIPDANIPRPRYPVTGTKFMDAMVSQYWVESGYSGDDPINNDPRDDDPSDTGDVSPLLKPSGLRVLDY